MEGSGGRDREPDRDRDPAVRRRRIRGFILIVRQIAPAETAVARPHSQYDAEIGWVSKSDVYLRDFYGPGRDFRTNSQSFRNTRDFAKEVPPGKVRIVCSGDSFTMGEGVSDDQTWCHRLAAANPRIESVNLGHSGYGVDQSYLWYKRNSDRLEHDIHLFAFISGDFRRMKKTVFHGYGKPPSRFETNLWSARMCRFRRRIAG